MIYRYLSPHYSASELIIIIIVAAKSAPDSVNVCTIAVLKIKCTKINLRPEGLKPFVH